MLRHLPNALTLLRLALAPLVAYAVWRGYALPVEALSAPNGYAGAAREAQGWATLGAVLFLAAALTDLFDGMAARALNAHSRFGRLIDPIADKLLVGLPLIAVAVVAWRAQWPLWPAIAAATALIVARDLLITVLRLFARDGEGAPVSRLAKWKTALELVAVGVPVLAAAAPALLQASGLGGGFALGGAAALAWVALLALAAALSVWTAAQYLTAR
jgi:CDP-diacylglycerol--glycerol-3-phosphate 3-phosphatidyltransferase